MTDVVQSLQSFPQAKLAHVPTPIEEMPNLARTAGDDRCRLFVKRDDCTGLAFGGNKIRQLEFYLGDAVAQNADSILITGAVQSNFVRSAAAAARKLSMEPHVQLEERVPDVSETYRNSGNVLLDRLLGARIYSYPEGEDEAGADRRLGEIAADLREQGRRPYIIPLGAGHPPLGALGYVVAAGELLAQLAEQDQEIDKIMVASGSGNTHAGLLFGLRAHGSTIPVHGICVRRSTSQQSPRLFQRCQDIATLLKIDNSVTEGDVICDDQFLAPGYGRMNDAVIEAIKLAAVSEALLVDPVYMGRVMAGAIHWARAAASSAAKSKSLLVIHTGGQPSIFAYEPELAALS